MTSGFALIAWPAVFESSGIMTFIVGPDGDVYQRDLGPDTARIAVAIKYGPMFNVLYDMTNLLAQTTGLAIPYFAPYVGVGVGVGVGYQWAHLSGFSTSGVGGFP
ncbi:MAG: DUF2950 family protein, partial [Acetobacteraceae bacterium]